MHSIFDFPFISVELIRVSVKKAGYFGFLT